MEDAREDIVEEIPDNSDLYPCDSCGATLTYKPGTDSLFCSHCGSYTKIDVLVVEQVEELDYHKYANQLEEVGQQTVKVINCRQCGAEATFEEHIKGSRCPYCDTPLIEKDIHEERLIQPSYLLPFNVSHDAIHTHMHTWLKGLWFAPNKLKKYALHTEDLRGVYFPCWTYDARTETDYKGQRGDNYTVTVGSGKNRRTVVKTRWSYRSGHISLFFDDVMVPASHIIDRKLMDKMKGWDTNNLVEKDRRFLTGFITEKYTLKLAKGFEIAKKVMDEGIKRAIKRDIGGDHQRILSSNTQYNDLRFKLILLPLYTSSYRYKNKLYHFYVNGRNGSITGDRPYSAAKITLAIIAGLIALAGLIYFFQ